MTGHGGGGGFIGWFSSIAGASDMVMSTVPKISTEGVEDGSAGSAAKKRSNKVNKRRKRAMTQIERHK